MVNRSAAGARRIARGPTTNGAQQAAEAVWLGLVSANAAAIRRLNGRLEGEGALPLNHYRALLRLSRARHGEMRRVDLAHALLLTPSGVARLVTRLEQEGHVAQGSQTATVASGAR